MGGGGGIGVELSRLRNIVQLTTTRRPHMGHAYDKFDQFPKSSLLFPHILEAYSFRPFVETE